MTTNTKNQNKRRFLADKKYINWRHFFASAVRPVLSIGLPYKNGRFLFNFPKSINSYLPQNKTALIQGFGNVGSYAAIYLQEQGVKIIGVLEYDCNLKNPDGINTKVCVIALISF